MKKLNDIQRAAIHRLFKTMNKILYNYALRYIRNEGYAENIVSQTFLIVCEKADEFMVSPNPQGYVFNITKNVLRSEVKAIVNGNSRFLYIDAYDKDGEFEIRDKENHFYETEYSDAVSPEDYEILKKLSVGNISVKELAKELGISEEACKKRVQRARNRMRKALEKIN